MPLHRASPHRALLSGAALALVVALAGCTAPAPATATGPVADQRSSAEPGRLPSAHVHGVGVDPGDGALLLATHEGLFEVGDGGAVTPVGPVTDLMGFAVAGAGHYVASGHPGLRVNLPNPVGLLESTDGGATWEPVSRQGQSDFHALTVLPDGGALGYDGALVRSADGRTWEQLAIPAEPHTIAAAPDGSRVLATTAQGLLWSADAGTSWSAVQGAPLLQVVTWSADGGTAVGVDPAGVVWTSTDGASSWQQTAPLGAAPHAVTADEKAQRIAVVTDDGLLQSTDGGQTFTVVLGN
jgi:hypothetical protein